MRGRFDVKVETVGSKGQTPTLTDSVKSKIVTTLVSDIYFAFKVAIN